MNDFEVKPISVEHILLLEKYERGKLREERGKNALSIGKAYFHELAALNNERSPEMTRDTNTSCTPRSTNPLLSNIADEVAMATQLIFRLEVQLAEEYPITYESKCSADKLFEVKSEDYDEAINEQRKAVDEQKKELEKLTEMMSLGDKKSIKIESEYEHLQEQINAGCLERIIEAEMNWHAKVKQLKIFRPLSHPTDRTDRVLWQRLETDPPFLSDPILKLRKNILTHISDAKENHSLWKEHFCCSSKRFLFIFPKPEIAITCVGAVYLPGATIADISNAQPSNVLSNSTVRPYIIEISPAIGRGPWTYPTLQLTALYAWAFRIKL